MTFLLHGSGFQRLVLIRLTLRLIQSEWGKICISVASGADGQRLYHKIFLHATKKRFKTTSHVKVRQ